MGEVLLLWDGATELRAAKSFRSATVRSIARFSDRFVQEAHAWLRVGPHRNVVEAYCVEKIVGRPFLLIEFVGGGSLADRLASARDGLTIERALRYAIDVCDGMVFAISRGLAAHRDLKPANCLLTDDDTVKITDFGLALWPLDPGTTCDSPSDGDCAVGTRLTNTGTVLGTPAYMAPEQFRDSRHGVSADVYSFGVMLFEMVTGRLPFHADNIADFALLHQQAALPALAKPFADLSGRRLERALHKCLRKEPRLRYQTFSELRDELADIYFVATGKQIAAAAEGVRLTAHHHNNRAASFGRLGLPEQELAEADLAIRLDPEYGLAWLNRGAALSKLGRHEEAVAALDKAIASGASTGTAWSNKGVSLEALRRFEDAMICHDRAVSMSPDESLVWTNRAATLAVQERVDDALTCLERALKLNPHSVAALLNSAYLHARRGEYSLSMRCCHDALRVDPKCANAWYWLGLSAAGLGDQEHARMFLEAAEKLGYPVDWADLTSP